VEPPHRPAEQLPQLVKRRVDQELDGAIDPQLARARAQAVQQRLVLGAAAPADDFQLGHAHRAPGLVRACSGFWS
jgi:hypothetical protein